MKAYLSKDANSRLIEYLISSGYDIETVETQGIVGRYISNHPDVFLCKMGISADSPIFPATTEDLGFEYPNDAVFCAACTGKYFIHNLSITAPLLKEAASALGMTMINVKQGYSKCNIAIIDENSIITSDAGIAKSCRRYTDLDILEITPGHIRLAGFDTGFIGGTCGRLGDEIVFNGDLTRHPDFASILEFIEARSLKCKWFPEYQLTDIGSIL